MIGKIRSRVGSAHLIGVIALVFAVGGAVALANVPKNSVNSNKVKNNTLKGVDVRNNSLTGADIRETSLNGNAIPGATGPQGPAGPPGPAGGGVSGASNLFFNAPVGTANTVLYNANGLEIRASCSAAEVLTSQAESSTDNSQIGTAEVQTGTDATDNNFDATDTINMVPSTVDADNYVFTHRQGAAGVSTTGEYWADDENAIDRCQLYGHLFTG